MRELIQEEITDMDGINCYITKGVLIRCKDCKHYDNEHDVCCVYLSYRLAKDANDYCSDAERKEE